MNKNDVKTKSNQNLFSVKTDVSPPIGVMQFCTESQVLVQQRDINSESK